MMKFKEFYVEDKNKKSNCVIRTFSKLFDKNYEIIKEELIDLTNKLNQNNFNDEIVFETYLLNNNYIILNDFNNKKIKDLNLGKGKYSIFCYDRKDYYHMIPIIDNIIYDKNDDCLELYVIKIYKKV